MRLGKDVNALKKASMHFSFVLDEKIVRISLARKMTNTQRTIEAGVGACEPPWLPTPVAAVGVEGSAGGRGREELRMSL